MKYLNYLKYVVRHKWYVAIECFKCGLFLRGVLHDNSKFLPDEFIPYADFFYGKKPATLRDKTGYYKPTNTGKKEFDFAWLLHQKRNRHHWQWWILPEDNGGVVIMKMEEPYLTEMICDWVGAGKAQGHFSPKDDRYLETRNWWKANNHKMQLHADTRAEIIKRIKV